MKSGYINYLILAILITFYAVNSRPYLIVTDNCITFTSNPDDNCLSMFTLCANHFETRYIKFISDVCYNKTDYLIGIPEPGSVYTCCNKITFNNHEF
jgi:hypothetical protein